MKTSGSRKEKTVEAPKKNNATTVCSGVKKARKRNCGRHQKASEDRGALPVSVVRVSEGKQLPNRGTSHRGATEVIPPPDLKAGQLHPFTKIKLQLFPIDGGTRVRVEKDGHNPFLELTVRARKKISSVLKHLNDKWGCSTLAQGELMLLPYNIQLEKLANYRRWTLNDNGISVGEVYSALESPAVFRLRYGWFSSLDFETLRVPPTYTLLEARSEADKNEKDCSTTAQDMCDNRKTVEGQKMKTDNGIAQSTVQWDDSLATLSIGGLLSEASLQRKINNGDPKSIGNRTDLRPIQFISDISIGGLLSEASLQGKIKNCDFKENGSKLGLNPTVDEGPAQSPFPWDDCFTTLSIGGLLSEASLLGKFGNCDSKSNGIKSGLQEPTVLISDSFSAFVGGQISSHPQVLNPSSHEPQSSILDAEETCHAFCFRKLSSGGKYDVPSDKRANSGGCSNSGGPNPFRLPNCPELNSQTKYAHGPLRQDSKVDPLPHSRAYNDESSLGLTGIKWNDSLGPFDLGLSSGQITRGDGNSISEFVR